MQSYGVCDGNDDDAGGLLLEVLLVEAKARNTDVAGDRLESAVKGGSARSHSDDDIVDNVGESEYCDDHCLDQSLLSGAEPQDLILTNGGKYI